MGGCEKGWCALIYTYPHTHTLSPWNLFSLQKKGGMLMSGIGIMMKILSDEVNLTILK